MSEIKRPKLNIVVIDFETTGFDPIKNEITEVGAVQIDGKTGEITNQFDALIKIIGKVPPKIVELTGITDDLLQQHGLPKELVGEYLKEMCENSIVVAHNASFDFSWAFHQFGIVPKYYYDTLTISRDLYPDEKSHKLGDICNRAGIKLENAHRAISDTLACSELLNKQLNKPGVAQNYLNVISGYRGLRFKPENTRKVI